MKPLKDSKIVITFDAIVDIFNVNEQNEVPSGKGKDFEVNSDPQD
jgi:hypothetical protein